MPDRQYVNYTNEIKTTRKSYQYVGFEVLIAVAIKNFIFWDIRSYNPVAGLIPRPEEGGDIFLRNVVNFRPATGRYIPEDGTLQYKYCYVRERLV
jgi:hypothetical protein